LIVLLFPQEQTMRKLFPIVAFVVAMATQAHADTWCMRDSSDLGISICAFSSGQDCFRAALINPAGSVCAREDAKPVIAAAPAGKVSGKRRAARSRRHASR
jgi:hypothetical protein